MKNCGKLQEAFCATTLVCQKEKKPATFETPKEFTITIQKNHHRMGARVLALIGALTLTCIGAQAADTVVAFDNLPPGTTVTNQYASAGVVFDSPPGCPQPIWSQIIQLPPGVAESGTQALNITAVAEVSTSGVCGLAVDAVAPAGSDHPARGRDPRGAQGRTGAVDDT